MRESRRRRGSVFAFVAAAAFAVGLSRFALERSGLPPVIDDGQPLGAVVAALPHLLLLVGVWPVLPARRWAKAAGLFWFALDLGSDVLALIGVPAEVFLTVRFIGHLGAAAWLIDASRHGRSAFRVVGLLTGVYLALYTLASPWAPPIVLAPSGPLLIIWCVLAGRHLRRLGVVRPGG